MRKLLSLLTIFAIVLSCSSDETSTPVTPPPAPIAKYTITLSAGEGGTVSTTGGEYEAGQTVSVTATPQGEYLFKDWSDGNTNATRTITVSSNSTLTANFEKRKYPLTVNIEGEGEVLEEIVNAGRTTDYDSGTTVKLTAVPAEGWEFAGWTGAMESEELEVQLLVSEAKTLSAIFEKDLVSYELTIVNSEGGSVSMESGSFIEGSEITLSVTVNNCFEFIGWEGFNSSEETISFNLNSNTTIKPIFNQTGEYYLNIDLEGKGTVYEVIGDLNSGTQYVEYVSRCFSEGEEIRLFAKPDDEYQFYGWRLPDGRTYDMNVGRVFKLGHNFDGDKTVNLTSNFVEHHFWEDPLYSSLNMDSTPEDIVRVFLEESSQYGWNFKDKVEDIIITNGPGSYSNASCQENTYININIPINDGPDSFTRWDFPKRMHVIYHELGHDLLNLSHVCLPVVHIMTGWDSCPLINGGNGRRDTSGLLYNGIEVQSAYLLMIPDDEVFSFKRSVRDMFELTGQTVECDIK